MRVPVAAATRDNLPRLLIRHIAVGTLVQPGRSGERRMGGRRGASWGSWLRSWDAANEPRTAATLCDDQTLLHCMHLLMQSCLNLQCSSKVRWKIQGSPNLVLALPPHLSVHPIKSNMATKLESLVLIHNFIYIHNLHTLFEIHNKNVLDTSTGWSKWNMTLFDTTSPDAAGNAGFFRREEFEKVFK